MPQDVPAAIARPRVALLIDGDNISHEQAGRILAEASNHGDAIIRRVYGNGSHLKGWGEAPGFHFRHAGTGKNAADLLLAIEAMDLMLSGRADLLVIASSDRDFSHLATHLRETGREVVGIGETKTCEAFRKNCTQFIELSPAAPPRATPPTTASTRSASLSVAPLAAAPASPEDRVAQVVSEHGSASGLLLIELGNLMRKHHDLSATKLGSQTWKSWFAARPELFEVDAGGADARVRLKAKARA